MKDSIIIIYIFLKIRETLTSRLKLNE